MNPLALFLTIALGITGCAGPSMGTRSSNLNATEKMMWSTYPLETQKGMATGFVIERRGARSSNPVQSVVVTSLHVLETIGSKPLVIGTRIPDAEGEPQIAIVRVKPDRSSGPFYVRHPTEDIGVFEMTIPAAATGAVRMPSFLQEKALRRQNRELRAGAEVSFLGYPEVMPLTSGVFPVLRTGKVASYPTVAMHSKRKVIINADVYPGDSGAPVFASGRNGKPELVGMIVQRIGRDPRTFAHFAIAVDARAIRETLQLLEEREVLAVSREKSSRERR